MFESLLEQPTGFNFAGQSVKETLGQVEFLGESNMLHLESYIAFVR